MGEGESWSGVVSRSRALVWHSERERGSPRADVKRLDASVRALVWHSERERGSPSPIYGRGGREVRAPASDAGFPIAGADGVLLGGEAVFGEGASVELLAGQMVDARAG